MFYDNFIRLCAEKGIPPTVAVVEMGFQKSVATRWKKSIPTDKNKKVVADYFGVSVDELLGEQKEKAPSEGSLTADQKDLLSIWDSIPQEKQADALRLLKVLSEPNKP